jgi:DNA-binding Lrp family transcriptional regulator
MFFSIPPRQRKAILQFLSSYPSITWLAENGGEFRYELTSTAHDCATLLRLEETIANKFGVDFQNKAWAIETDCYIFGYKYLCSEQSQKPAGQHYYYTGAAPSVTTDELDYKILSALWASHNPNQQQLSRQLGLPSATLAYRVNRLKKAGVILSERTFINPTKFGFAEYQLLLYFDSPNRESTAKLLEWSAQHSNIFGAIKCFGAWNYKLILHTSSPESAYDLQDEISDRFSVVSRSAIVPRRHILKVSSTLSLRSSAATSATP